LNNSFYYFTFFFFLVSINSYSQQLKLKIYSKDSLQGEFLKEINYKKEQLDSTSIIKELELINLNLKKIGFLNNKMLYLKKTDTLYSAVFNLNNKFEKIRINLSKDLKTFLNSNNSNYTYNKKYIELDWNKTPLFLNELVLFFEQNGNSFAQVYLKNITLNDNHAVADIYITKNISRTIDKIIVKGYSKFPKKYISNHLDIKLNGKFNTGKLALISKNIKTISFVEEIKKPQTLFTKDSTLIYIYLKKKRANRFDGLVGFSSNKNNSNLDFEGYLNIQLNNIFNSGEQLKLLWQSNANQNKKLELEIETPYIFNSKFTPRALLDIYNQDSTFINITSLLSIDYKLKNNTSLGGVIESRNATDLTKSTLSNNISNFSSFFYGINYNYKTLTNHVLFPVKHHLSISTLFGTRKSLNNTKKQQKINLNSSYSYLITSKHSVSLKNSSSALISDNYIDNELFRIGGAKSIRGFQENSILSTVHSIFSLEYRLSTNKSSYIYSITDYAYNYNKSSNIKTNLFSLGLGYAFTTKAGLLNLSYALGKTNTSPFNFNDATLHLNLITFF